MHYAGDILENKTPAPPFGDDDDADDVTIASLLLL